MTDLLKSLIAGRAISGREAESAMTEIIGGTIPAEQAGAFLTAFAFRAPSASVLAGFARAFRAEMIASTAVDVFNDSVVDVCGTGGDGLNTFNISTTTAFVVAACDVPIAKHGNRAVSSRSGSFDVLEAMGVGVCDTFGEAELSLRRHRLAFLYAPAFHPAVRRLSALRRSLGFRTVINALGPMLNPIGVRRQLIGVYTRELVVPMAEALGELGATDAIVVHGDDGLDEISIAAPTTIARLANGRVAVERVSPETFGVAPQPLSRIAGGAATENARISRLVLTDPKSVAAATDVVLLNSAAGLMVGGRAEDLKDGFEIARQALFSGRAARLLDDMKEAQSLGAAL